MIIRIILNLLLVLMFPITGSAYTCKITNYMGVESGLSKEVAESWIPKDFIITSKEYARVGYKGYEVDRVSDTTSSTIFNITANITDNSGYSQPNYYTLVLYKQNMKIHVTLRSGGYKDMVAQGTCSGSLKSTRGTSKTSNKNTQVLREVFNQFSQNTRKMMQEKLFLLGFYNSSIDGKWGKNTNKAFIKFAEIKGMTNDLKSTQGARKVINKLLSN